MKKYALTLLLALAPAFAAASGDLKLLDIKADHSNKESLQNGAKMYVNYCMGCHSLKYMRFERMADDLEIPHELVQQNLNPAGTAVANYEAKKIG